MKIKVSEASGKVLDWMVTKALGGCTLMDEAAVRAYLMSLDEDDLWNTLCTYTPGGMDASIMDRLELIDYGVSNWQKPAYSTDWAKGGLIIDREKIGLSWLGYWSAASEIDIKVPYQKGPTALIAVMRCYVASKLGEEVDVPEEMT